MWLYNLVEAVFCIFFFPFLEKMCVRTCVFGHTEQGYPKTDCTFGWPLSPPNDLLFLVDSHRHKYKEHKHKDHKKDKEREKLKHGNGYKLQTAYTSSTGVAPDIHFVPANLISAARVCFHVLPHQ